MQIRLLINKLFRKFFFRTKVCIKKKGNKKNILIYYKTDIFCFKPFDIEFHSNNNEIKLMTNKFISKGFNITVIDRTATLKTIKKVINRNYDIFLSQCSGNSSPFLNYIYENINAKKKIAYATGPDPYTANKLVLDRHEDCKKRTKNFFHIRRLVRGKKKELNHRFQKSDYIFCMGKDFSKSTYEKYDKEIFCINPTIPDKLNFNFSKIKNKNPRNLIYVGGSGNICKGLDLVIDAVIEISKTDTIYLDVFAPGHKKMKSNNNLNFAEQDFWDYYLPIVNNCQFITLHGFVPLNSKEFIERSEICAFNIFPTAAEACATSVINCMRRAIIPVSNYESGINVKNSGILLKKPEITEVTDTIRKCIKMNQKEVEELCIKNYIASLQYTPENFVQEINLALEKINIDNR